MPINTIEELSIAARKAIQARNWQAASIYAQNIYNLNPNEPEGAFLSGMCKKNTGQLLDAIAEFQRTLSLNHSRYDAAIELASLFLQTGRHLDALTLLDKHEGNLLNSPLYLNTAGSIFAKLGLHDRAHALFRKADSLQPNAEPIQANLAESCVYTGKINSAIQIYSNLLSRFPYHQRYHYELSRLSKAVDSKHVDAMKKCLMETKLPDERNIFIYYALGKELEELQHWDEAFYYYQLAGNAASQASKYDVSKDTSVIDTIIETCNEEWLSQPTFSTNHTTSKTPIFVVGLPRTGTTLIDRIVSSHSKVQSTGENFFIQTALQKASGFTPAEDISPKLIERAVETDPQIIAKDYLNSISYKLDDSTFFVDKLPENFIYLGFIAKAFPNAKIINIRRNAMDACFALYKQLYFRYAYNFNDLGEYYLAYDRLYKHWSRVLKNRIIEVNYEHLVNDQEREIKSLLGKLELEFEAQCLDFQNSPTISATASAAQVREKIHSNSVFRWKKFAKQLEPLRKTLDCAGIHTIE